MALSLIDSHCHLTSSELVKDLDSIIERAKAAGVSSIINVCTDVSSLEEGVKIQEKYPRSIFNIAAVHPHDVAKEGELFFPVVKKYAKERKLVAIGETGLDYFYEYSPKEVQQDFLRNHIALAALVQKPLVFHCRNAFEDLFAIANELNIASPCVVHCFTDSLKVAKSILNLGWYLSFTGIITFKKSEMLREIVKYVPLDRMFVETDAPFLAPESKRGKVNEPAYVVEIAEMVASVKGMDLKKVSEILKKTTSDFFSLT
ncbi:MAG: TatD family hydrolase [Chlamydiae bacterium]|nr:TatD family hydrolase [Chlamydiota bacterium]